MKWQDISNGAVFHSQRINQQAVLRGAPRAQVGLVAPVLPPGRAKYGVGADIIGWS